MIITNVTIGIMRPYKKFLRKLRKISIIGIPIDTKK